MENILIKNSFNIKNAVKRINPYIYIYIYIGVILFLKNIEYNNST